VVLEGDFTPETAGRVRDALAGAALIELTARNGMQRNGPAPVVGTYQGVWPGLQLTHFGDVDVRAGPTGSTWIDSNSGLIRAARAWGHSVVWMGYRPPSAIIEAIPVERYLQAIADAEIAGGRWIIDLDDDFAARLAGGDAAAQRGWKRMTQLLAYFEAHREWRSLQPYGRLVLVDRPGAMLSAGALDMLLAQNVPVRPIPSAHLAREALQDAHMAIDMEPGDLAPAQREVLDRFQRSGGTVLGPSPGWKPPPDGNVLRDAEQNGLDEILHNLQLAVGRNNLGVRVFNASSIRSNLMASPDGKRLLLHLVNYSSYPMENITVQVLGKFKRARLFTPEGIPRDLDVHPIEEGTSVDLNRLEVCASIELLK
jgi:hypothetical protein